MDSQKFFDDFPEMFGEHTFDFSIEKGWMPIVYELCLSLAKIDPEVKVVQVKEKFGGLRFYVGAGTDEAFDLIDETEEYLNHICEKCGSAEDVTTEGKGWIKTMCHHCHVEREMRFLH